MKDLADPIEAADYLTSCVEEGQEVFLLALRDVAKAQGGIAKLAFDLDRKLGIMKSCKAVFRRPNDSFQFFDHTGPNDGGHRKSQPRCFCGA